MRRLTRGGYSGHTNVVFHEKRGLAFLEEYFVEPDYDEPLTQEQIVSDERVIIEEIMRALGNMTATTLSHVTDTTGLRGMRKTQDSVAGRDGVSATDVNARLHRAYREIELVMGDEPMQSALETLGLQKFGPRELLFAFDNELREEMARRT